MNLCSAWINAMPEKAVLFLRMSNEMLPGFAAKNSLDVG